MKRSVLRRRHAADNRLGVHFMRLAYLCGASLPVVFSLAILSARAVAADVRPYPGGGFVAGNFGIAAQVIENGALTTKIKVNPPQFGKWLEDFGIGSLWIEDADS